MTSARLPGDLATVSDRQARVVSLRQLTEGNVSRGQRRANVSAGRWADLPGRGVITDLGPVEGRSTWWRAVTVLGPHARLGGVTALEADGLTGYVEPLTHVWLPKSSYKGRLDGVRLHETRRWDSTDAAPNGIPRARAEVATVQAALWARSPRQAALCMVMPIQQRIVRADDVSEVLTRVRRHRYRRMLQACIHDIAAGAHSLGELDFAQMCRQRGLPEPSRQVVRRTGRGRAYLDVYWKAFRVALEVNGAGHERLDQVMHDEIRTMDVQVQGDTAIQVSVLTLRCAPEPFFSKLGELLHANGWIRSV
jgi:hypothetical protein